MDRHQIFHDIATKANLASMNSILRTTLHQVINISGAERVAYFATGTGLLRPLGALNKAGSDALQNTKQIPREPLQRVIATSHPQQGEWLARKIRYIAVPAMSGKRVDGILWLERRMGQNTLPNRDSAVLRELLGDVQILLNSSRDYERQRYEMDTVKSQIAMSQLQMISAHPSMIHLFKLIRKLSRVPSTVLIHGESGTGKEMVARAIYELGTYEGPFISMNCGAIESNLLKSELFGFVRGSFTGANRDRPGLFKNAEGGILFMDEIAEMPSDMQISLLRTLENGELLPVGADAPRVVHTRVVAATHRNLRDMVARGEFRNDLYQRLKGLTLEVPPLRQRREDIPLLCEHFRKKYNARLNTDFKGFKPNALKVLEELDYRAGNVRELEHIIERAMVFEDNPHFITQTYLNVEEDQPLQMGNATGAIDINETFEEHMNQYAVNILKQAIRICGGNKTKAMKKLGLSRSTFYGMLNRYGVAVGGER